MADQRPRPEDAGDTRNLPAVPGNAESAVLEGRVVEDAPRSVPRQAVHVIRTVARHEHSRAAARNAAYIGIGAAVTVKRLWDSRSTARHERWIRSAERSGDH